MGWPVMGGRGSAGRAHTGSGRSKWPGVELRADVGYGEDRDIYRDGQPLGAAIESPDGTFRAVGADASSISDGHKTRDQAVQAVLDQPQLFPPEPIATDPAALESAIREAYEQARLEVHAGDPGARWVDLADLRSRLEQIAPGLPREEVDRALDKLIESPDVRFMAELNQKSLTEAREAAAVNIGDEDRHLMHIDRPEAHAPMPLSGEKTSQAPLPNHWGTPGGPVNFHDHGEIGRAISGMGTDAQIDVDGQPLADVLGRLATDAVVGRSNSQHVLDELKILRDRLPAGSRARRCVGAAVDQLDAPDSPPPAVPDGTSAPLRRLVTDLHAIPLVRRDPSKEMQPLLDLIKSSTGGDLRLSSVRQLRALINRRHESVEGKFDIDRAVRDAAEAAEQLIRERRERGR